MSTPGIPLCVDLDGTLTRTDLLFESVLELLKRNPLYLFMCFRWLLRGKSYMKEQIARRVSIDVDILPYNEKLAQFLEAEQKRGRRLYLCTASDEKFANQVAGHFGFFDGVMSSNGEVNLRGRHKADALAHRFGERGFDYCGNDLTDVPVWKRAHAAIVVGNPRIVSAARKVNETIIQFDRARTPVKTTLKAMRVYQWCKNVLIFLPLLASHQFTDRLSVAHALVAFFAFSFCASAVYMLNDMLDLDSDRRHARKRKRPFASGELSLARGMSVTALLLALSAALASLLSLKFGLVLAVYFAFTLAYSLALKRMLLVDVFALAALYSARVLAGGAAVGVQLSYWLILLSLLIFLSLAMVKRYAELNAAQAEGKGTAAGRGYTIGDMSILRSFGGAAGYTAALVLALYMNSPEVRVMYHHQGVLWAIFALMLFWISWVWMAAFRGRMHDDPIVFALKDRVSLGVIAVCAAGVVLAS